MALPEEGGGVVRPESKGIDSSLGLLGKGGAARWCVCRDWCRMSFVPNQRLVLRAESYESGEYGFALVLRIGNSILLVVISYLQVTGPKL